MTTLEIVLLVLGALIFVGSFIVPETKSEMDEVDKGLTQEQIQEMLKEEVKGVRDRVEDTVEETVSYSMERTERALERITNEKLSAISEYTETVLTDIHKSHEEVLFLFDMLNDKHENIKETATEVNKAVKEANVALQEADMTFENIDAIAVTYGPGLVGALLVGVSAAKALAFGLKKPLIGVHHIEGHISANFIEHKDLEPPFVCLVASGGHSHIVLCEDYGVFRILGRTRDDAAGEAFDKISRALGLGYPGGPKIDREAKHGNPEAIHFPETKFQDSLDFSFSGVKTAVLN